MARVPPILIAGGGISGISLALALGHRGLASIVLERATDFSEAGAGIQLGPNATRVLGRIGVASRLAAHAGKPAGLMVHDGRTGRHLATLPLGDWILARHGMPYWVAHRADLHTALLDTARAHPLVTIETGFDVTAIETSGETAIVRERSGRQHAGLIVAGADGLWSTVRRLLWHTEAPPFTGRTATRALVPATAVRATFDLQHMGVWLAPGVHVVHYPIRGGTEIAVVVIARDDWSEEGWGAPADPAELMTRTAHLAPDIRSFLGRAREWRRWALFDPPPLPCWSKGRATLLGDAAHPIMPFLAQGGAMGIEDADCLAEALAATPHSPEAALEAYERVRRPRVARVQAATRRNGWIYHLDGPLAAARNLVLRTASRERLMKTYDWLYGWTGEDAASRTTSEH